MNKYLIDVEQRFIELIAATPEASFQDLLQRSQGIPPDILVKVAGRYDRSYGFPSESHARECSSIEPHPLDFAWRFEGSSANAVADQVCSLGSTIGLFGTPSVGTALKTRNRFATLFDHNAAANIGLSLDFVQTDLCDRSQAIPSKAFDVLMLDPPWYPELAIVWIEKALSILKRKGVILVSLWGELIRPTARKERDWLLSRLGRIGSLQVLPAALTYESPLYERAAFMEQGIAVPEYWRKGDLAIIRFENDIKLPKSTSLKPVSEWLRFEVENRQVAIRYPKYWSPKHQSSDIEIQIAASVSRRAPERATIDIWGSNGRTASFKKRKQLEHLVNVVIGGGTVPNELRPILNIQSGLSAAIENPWRQTEWMK